MRQTYIYLIIFILFVQYFSSVLWRKRSRIGKKPSLTQVKNSEKVETTHTATELCMLCLSGTNTIPQCHDLKNNSWTLSPWHAVTENNQGGGRKCWFFFPHITHCRAARFCRGTGLCIAADCMQIASTLMSAIGSRFTLFSVRNVIDFGVITLLPPFCIQGLVLLHGRMWGIKLCHDLLFLSLPCRVRDKDES